MVHSGVRISCDLATPILLIPTALLLATFGPIATKIVFVVLPCVLLGAHRSWSRHGVSKSPSRLFYVWTLTSAILMYSVYMIVVVGFREVLLWETMLMTTLFGTTVSFLRCARRNPGVIKRAVENELNRNWEEDLDNLRGVSSSSFCSECRIERPLRADHCSLCKVCVHGLDHHCIWIDSCIGAYNHRSFLMALLSGILTGSYGVHLALTTICTPEMYLGWFLWPTDCRYVYSDLPNAVIYVSACYTCLCVFGLCLILVKQVFLISQNVLMRELEVATSKGLTRFLWFVTDNRHDLGLRRNWKEFLGRRRNYYRGSNLTQL